MDNEKDTKEIPLERVKKRLDLFFPADSYSFTSEAIEEGLETGDFMAQPSAILPYLQTALLDNKILEVEIDGMTRVFFSRLYDDLPDMEEVEEEGETVLVEPDYNAGDYLKRLSHLICLPLEPGMGNLQVRNSQHLIIRLFTSAAAIELGTFFQDLATVRDLPVLRLSFPVVGRQVRGTRAFRAKVTKKAALSVFVKGTKKRPSIDTHAIDISANGMAFEIQKDEQHYFEENDIIPLQFTLDGFYLGKVSGNVRHVSKIRQKKGIQYRCGVQFDLPTRAAAEMIESIVAKVQRVHLKSLSDKAEESGLDLVK